jgi:hypothetical protein
MAGQAGVLRFLHHSHLAELGKQFLQLYEATQAAITQETCLDTEAEAVAVRMRLVQQALHRRVVMAVLAGHRQLLAHLLLIAGVVVAVSLLEQALL